MALQSNLKSASKQNESLNQSNNKLMVSKNPQAKTMYFDKQRQQLQKLDQDHKQQAQELLKEKKAVESLNRINKKFCQEISLQYGVNIDNLDQVKELIRRNHTQQPSELEMALQSSNNNSQEMSSQSIPISFGSSKHNKAPAKFQFGGGVQKITGTTAAPKKKLMFG